jgi:hypothetical protein
LHHSPPRVSKGIPDLVQIPSTIPLCNNFSTLRPPPMLAGGSLRLTQALELAFTCPPTYVRSKERDMTFATPYPFYKYLNLCLHIPTVGHWKRTWIKMEPLINMCLGPSRGARRQRPAIAPSSRSGQCRHPRKQAPPSPRSTEFVADQARQRATKRPGQHSQRCGLRAHWKAQRRRVEHVRLRGRTYTVVALRSPAKCRERVAWPYAHGERQLQCDR